MSEQAICTALTLAAIAAVFIVILFVVCRPASADGLTPAMKALIMNLSDAASAISNAATAISGAAQGLTDAAAKIGALNDTSALDQPVTDLGAAVTALQTAAAAVEAAASPAA